MTQSIADQLAQDSAGTPLGYETEGVPEQIASKAEQLRNLINLVSGLQDEIKTASKMMKQIEEHDLPELLDELGTDVWGNDQVKVNIATKIVGNFPKNPEKIETAIEEINRLEHGDKLVIEMVVNYEKGQMNIALEHAELIDERLPESNKEAPIVRYKIHPQTLKKLCKDSVEAGIDIDLAKLGMYQVTKAEVS